MPLPNYLAPEIRDLIGANNFDGFIGAYESDIFDAKGTPYQLSQDNQKYELAKDLASFANASGGYILIGLSTKAAPAAATDEVAEIRAFDFELVNPAQYLAVAKDRIYPAILGLDIRWLEHKRTPGKGLLVIEIPPQREEDKFFLVNGIYDGNTKLPQTVFGIPIRMLSVNQPLSIVKLHHLVREGRDTGPRLDRIERKLSRLEEPKPSRSPELVQDALKRRINRLINEVSGS